jgi:hypothetical protein
MNAVPWRSRRWPSCVNTTKLYPDNNLRIHPPNIAGGARRRLFAELSGNRAIQRGRQQCGLLLASSLKHSQLSSAA